MLIRVLAVVLAFLLAFATGGFWKKISHDVVQPTVHYSGDALMVLEVRCLQEQPWHAPLAVMLHVIEGQSQK